MAARLVQAGLVLIAVGRYRVPQAVAARMMGNVLLDIGVGAIPLLGDLFDVAFKANTRNMALLEPYLPTGREGAPQEKWVGHEITDVTPAVTSWGCLLAIAVALLDSLMLVLNGFITVVRWLLRSAMPEQLRPIGPERLCRTPWEADRLKVGRARETIERTSAWMLGWPRLGRDYKRGIESNAAMIRLAMIHLMVRRRQCMT